MKITDKNYRMSKPLKTFLALMKKPENRNAIKRAMIEGEVIALRYRNSRRTQGERNEPESKE